RISECLAICHYLEDLHPEPNLFGAGRDERAQVLMWNHIVEQEGMPGLAEALRNRINNFRDHALPGPVAYAQLPELVERGRKRARHFLDFMDRRLTGREYLALDRFTIADITLRVAVDMAARMASKFDLTVLDDRAALTAWHSRVSERPSLQGGA
ncbi:MAG: glutathione binding-like protein, partial [Gammaproteobacteria bacterium]|nr:glutathione binding-like protein [Gammaproteobacteria bacterium]